jgi:hypothetical protein
MSKIIRGFKGFDKDLKCRGFQFKVGKEYEEPEAVICEKGFHFCENPLDVLNYYDLCDSEFAEVESSGKTDKHSGDSKIATTKMKINAKLSLDGFIKASVDFLLSVAKKSNKTAASGDYSKLAASGDSSKLAASGYSSQLAASGYSSQLAASGDSSKLAASGHYSKLAASGDSSKLAASGDYSQLAASGDYSKLEINGEYSVGAAIGMGSIIKGKKGNWITLAEWAWDNKKKYYIPVCVKSAQIDGKKIKADTFYQLENGKFVEADSQ